MAMLDEQPTTEELSREEQVFGRNIFNTRNLTFEPNNNLPTPPNYRLGPGDEVVIDIWGASQNTIRQTISPDGTINLQELGPAYLSGMTVEEAGRFLKAELGKIYSNENNQIRVTLGNTRTIQINIMGEVVQPGTYALSAFSTVFHALYRAGGVNRIGSLRDVQLVRQCCCPVYERPAGAGVRAGKRQAGQGTETDSGRAGPPRRDEGAGPPREGTV